MAAEMTIDELRLRQLLEKRGFSIEKNHSIQRGNDCTWYAWRRTELSARECDHNTGATQLVVYPHAMRFNGRDHFSVEAEVVGEAQGMWFKLRAYGCGADEFMGRLDEIEASLIAAWNALHRGIACPANTDE